MQSFDVMGPIPLVESDLGSCTSLNTMHFP